MFGKLVLKGIIKSVELDSIRIDYRRCINNNGYGYICTECEDVCTENAIAKNGIIDSEICRACNTCSTVCPVQAISPAYSLIDTLDESMQSDNNDIAVSCSKCSGNGDIKVECIGSVAWELYVVMSLCKNIIIQTGKCEACENAAVKKVVTDKIGYFMETDFLKSNIRTVASFDNERDGYTRREMFGIAKRKSGRKLKAISSVNRKKYSGMPFYRGYLISEIRKYGRSDFVLNWQTPNFSEKCWGCGLCFDICPNDALIKVNEEMYIIPWLCTQCGICEKYCPDSAINGYQKCDFDPLNQKFIKLDINKVICSECGHAMRKRKGRYRCLYCGGK